MRNTCLARNQWIFLREFVLVLAFSCMLVIALGWIISHTIIGDPWAFGAHHPVYLLAVGLTIGLPFLIPALVFVPFALSFWLRCARKNRINLAA